MTDIYEVFLKRIREIGTLNSVMAILGWDRELHMPPHGGDGRASQLAMLSALAHGRATSVELGELLRQLEASLEPSIEAAVNIREIKRSYERKRKLPHDLVEEMARTRSQAMDALRVARQAKSFLLFRPVLEKHVDLQRRAADLFGYETEPYDALLDEYEPGMTARQLETMFSGLREAIVPIIRQCRKSPPMDRSIFARTYPVDAQRQWARVLTDAVGFDLEAGRLDFCTHAFTEAGGIDDVRLTVRCNPNDPLAMTYSLLHELGHGLYEQNFDRQHQNTPMAQSVSLGVHESQARMWENIVGRSRAFWQFALPQFKAVFKDVAADLDLASAYGCANEVRPSLRRVGSDEVTYNLHVIFRFVLERDLINGRLRVADLPEAWNAAMQTYLGLTPPDEAQGVLQDVHWAMYGAGYFPTYVLGNLYAAQMYEAAECDLPELSGQLAEGVFSPLRDWLRDRVHCHGMRYGASELITRISGYPPSSGPFVRYLRAKFVPADAKE